MASNATPVTNIANADAAALRARCVYIIDDDADVRKSLHFLLTASSITAWPFANASDFIEQLHDLAPAPILLDIRMPGIGGLEMLEILREREVRWPVVVMTAHGDVSIAVRAMKLGAIEFLEKPFVPDVLDHAITHAFKVLDDIERSLRARDHARSSLRLLSTRESEVVRILTAGVPNKVVAQQLGLGARTVEMHRANALARLGLKSIAEVLSLMLTAELSPPGDGPLKENH